MKLGGRRGRVKWDKVIFCFVLITLVFSSVYSVAELINAPSAGEHMEIYEHTRSEYALMLTQCILGIIVLFLPALLEKRLKIVLPSRMMIVYAVFLYCAIYLGEVRSFYYLVPNWDTVLHVFSGAMLGALGLSVVTLLNRSAAVRLRMSPLFIVIFSFCFAVSLGVIWEIYEFTVDGLFTTNMQKYASGSGVPFIGQAALEDTMKDMIVDVLGALVMSVFGFFSIKRKPDWIENFDISAARENKPGEPKKETEKEWKI